MMKTFLRFLITLVSLVGTALVQADETYDVVVYGGTSGGVTAAVQAGKMGKKTVLLEFGNHLGGLTSGGLSAIDWGRFGRAPYGGLCNEFFDRVGKQKGTPFCAAAEKAFTDMAKEAGVTVLFEQRLIGCAKEGNRVVEITMDGGRRFRARVFVDATYEGDLMAAAGVSYHVGREANSVYNETLNGITTGGAHNFTKPVDPYVVEGDPKSGLLWGVSAEPLGDKGDGDRRVQAYNFRMQFSKGGRPFPKPNGYDPARYDLLLRYIKAGGGPGVYPHQGDNNNQGGFSTDNIGRNYDWPDGPARGDLTVKKDEAYFRQLYKLRDQIYQDHLDYQQGLVWFLAHDNRVPQDNRDKMKDWGLTPGQFPDTDGWPHALYVREGRRMISDYVMTEHNCRSKTVAEDSVGLGAYTMDSHNCQRVIVNGKVRNEGDVQTGIPQPYPIAYRSLVPKEAECANLLVPVCLSSSHIAYGSIRMEPVFMVIGQSAGTAASLAIDDKVDIQKVAYPKLRERLLADKQVLEWAGGTKVERAEPVHLPGIVVDDRDAKLTGEWSRGSFGGIGGGYQHDSNDGKGKKSARFELKVPNDGTYEVRLAYSPNSNRATNVPVTIESAEGTKTEHVNQKKPPPIDGKFVSLGKYRFTANKPAVVTVSNEGTDGHVIIDAVQLLPAP